MGYGKQTWINHFFFIVPGVHDLQVKCSLMVMLCRGPWIMVMVMVVADTWARVRHLGRHKGICRPETQTDFAWKCAQEYHEYSCLVDTTLMAAEGKSPWWFRRSSECVSSSEGSFWCDCWKDGTSTPSESSLCRWWLCWRLGWHHAYLSVKTVAGRVREVSARVSVSDCKECSSCSVYIEDVISCAGDVWVMYLHYS